MAKTKSLSRLARLGYTSRMANVITSVERQEALNASLRRLCLVLETVRCCVVVSDDGLPIAAYATDDADAEAELAALSASLTGMGQRALDRLSGGKRGRLVLEGEAGTMLCTPVAGVSLALLLRPDANLAQALFASQKAADEIAAALDGD